MWCVAEINDEYKEKMENVLATYEKDYDPREPVVCVDERPLVLHAEVREPIATPKHGSWLNQAEIEISMFSRQCLGKDRVADLATMKRRAHAWNRRMNRDEIKINWTFTRQKARKKFKYRKIKIRRSEH